jgi:hypothetical protein
MPCSGRHGKAGQAQTEALWQHDRAMWFAAHHIKWSPNACTEEALRRRRVLAWQEDHPEDAGR